MLNKWQRIQLVKKWGLNTENSILLSIDEPASANMIHLSSFLMTHANVSIRTFKAVDDRMITPHFPTNNRIEAIDNCNKMLSEDINCIVADQIDPADSLLAGTIWKHDSIYEMEFAKGPCTVRKVTHDGIIDYKAEMNRNGLKISTPTDSNVATRLYDMAQAVRNVFALDNCIFEMSYYNHPIGILNSPVIVWEITDDGDIFNRVKTLADMEAIMKRG